MNADTLHAELDRDLIASISRVSAYASEIIWSSKDISHLAERLNREMPPRLEDLQRSFVADLEAKLTSVCEQTVRDMDARVRIKYYDAQIEREIMMGIRFLVWPEWHPRLVPKIQRAVTGCAVVSGLGAGLSLVNATGNMPFKLPSLFNSPVAAASVFLLFTSAACAVVLKPDAFPKIVDNEKKCAHNHVLLHLDNLRKELIQAAKNAAESTHVQLSALINSNHNQSSK